MSDGTATDPSLVSSMPPNKKSSGKARVVALPCSQDRVPAHEESEGGGEREAKEEGKNKGKESKEKKDQKEKGIAGFCSFDRRRFLFL